MGLPVIQISTGLVQGVPSEYNDSITVYKGLPFAADTSGDNRWREPQPPLPWEGVRIADTFGPVCPQVMPGFMADGSLIQSEDCLSLNVWTPAKSSDEKLPVYVWIYGGRFTFGRGSDPSFDGTGLASKGAIVVTINYRLGILGFLATPELSQESGHNASGNYGILDQLAALKWVKENIAAFGGDPLKVTVGGQSAGAASAALHVQSPLSRGLLRGAIIQSGYRYPRDPLLSGLAPAYRLKDKAEAQGTAILGEKGASNIAELRKLGLDTLLEGNNRNDDVWGTPPLFRPVLDGWVFASTYAESLKNGNVADIPILTGHNADEGGNYADPEFNEEDFKSCAQQKFGPLAEKFFVLYPVGGTVSALQAWNDSTRDGSRITVSLWTEEFHKVNKSPVFGYNFTHAPPSPPPPPNAGPQKKPAPGPGGNTSRSTYTYMKPGPGPRGVFHGAEIPFVFNNFYAQREKDLFGDDDKAVAELLSSYWVNFIKSGNPNSEGLPEFVSTGSERIMRLGKDSKGISLSDSPEKIAFWKEHLDRQKPY